MIKRDHIIQNIPFHKISHHELKANGLIVVETFKIVKKALEKQLKLVALYIPIDSSGNEKNHRHNLQHVTSYDLTALTHFYRPKESLQGDSGITFSLFALFEYPEELPLTAAFENLKSQPALFLNGLSSPENVGSLMRSANAFGFKNIFVDAKTCSPYYKRCIRVSMGNVFDLHIYSLHNFDEFKKLLLETETSLMACHFKTYSKPMRDVPPPQKVIYAIGSEGHGLDQNLIETALHHIHIPMNPKAEHLNASVAGAIIMAEHYAYLNS
jgi:tRNA G18 (ribose-2'-O)-methylase SpoU